MILLRIHAKKSSLIFMYIQHAKLQQHLYLCTHKTSLIWVWMLDLQDIYKICFSLTFTVNWKYYCSVLHINDWFHAFNNEPYSSHSVLWWVIVLMKTSAKKYKHSHLKVKLQRIPYKAVNQHNLTGCDDQCMLRILKTSEECSLGGTDQIVPF